MPSAFIGVVMLSDILAPFRARNYRLFWFGQAVSLTGGWLTQTAVNWLVFALSGSVVVQGWFSFLQQVPTTFLAPFAGVWADRTDRRRLLVATQLAGMASSCGLAGYAWFDGKTLPWLGVFCVVRGVVSAAEVPARQVMVIRFVEDPALLGRAIALNSTLFNLTRSVGPALAGWLYVHGETLSGPAAGGAFICFVADALSFVPVLWMLMTMRLTPEPVSTVPRQHPLRELAEGVRYARSHPVTRTLLPTMGALSLFGLSYSVLLPRLARVEFAGDSRTFGGLLAAMAFGAFLAAAALAMRTSTRGLSRRIAFGALCLSAALAGLSFIPPKPVAWALLALAGFGGVLAMAGTNTLLQTEVEERFRGRVIGLFHLSFSGMLPFGALLAGALADHAGLKFAMYLASFVSGLIAWRVFMMPCPSSERE
jgi:MFS family permease